MKTVVVSVIVFLLAGCSMIRGGAEGAMRSSSPTANIIGGIVYACSGNEETSKAKTEETQKMDAAALWDQAAAPVIAQHPDFEHVVYEVFGRAVFQPQTENDKAWAQMWQEEPDKSPANAYRYGRSYIMMQEEKSNSSKINTSLQIQENSYGPGIHSDQFGRAVRYEVPNWPANEPTENLRVTPDVYGPGIGQDQYGRPVTVSP